MSERRVAVIGGGISGLATAEAIVRRAKEAGVETRVVVLEGEDAPGGKIQTFERDGFVVETGPHGFLDREPKMFELIERLGIQDELVPADETSARRFIMREGQLRELPGSPPAFLKSDILPLWDKLRVCLEPFMPGPSTEEETVREFASRRIGQGAADVLVDAMVTGIYGGDPSRLSLKSAFPRMFELESTYGSLVRAQFAVAKQRRLAAPKDGPPPKKTPTGAPAGTLHSFKRGLGTLIDALASRLEVQTGGWVQGIERAGDKWKVAHRGEELEVDAVVSSVPAFVAQPLFAPLQPTLSEKLGAVPYAACSVVVHGYKEEDVDKSLEGFGFLVPGGEKKNILGSIWASTVFPDHAPKGMVMFRTMVGGARRPDLARKSEEEYAELARHELVGVRSGAKPVLETVIPWTRAIPQYELGHSLHVEAADAVETELPGCFVTGNAYRGVAVLSCVLDADRVGERVVKYLADGPISP